MGVRITLHQPPYDRWFRDHLVDDFLSAAEAQHVPVEVFAPFQTAELGEVARRHPELQLLADHTMIRIMKEHPDRFFHWNDVLRLGELPNIWMKISYFPEAAVGTETYPFPHSQEPLQAALRPYRCRQDGVGLELPAGEPCLPPTRPRSTSSRMSAIS